jgi:TonB-linked SusC/RagA family outer membrane protein
MKKNQFLVLITLGLFLLSGQVLGQIIALQGTVTDGMNGEPIPGVNVLVQGTTNGTITDVNGRYHLSVKKKDVVEFSFIGMVTQSFRVGEKTTIDVVMESDFVQLNEVVKVGYGTVKRSDLTGAVASVTSDDLQQVKAPSFAEALQGRIAGVQITSQSGEPGSGVDVTIRGANSINAGTQPLYVIDGIQVEMSAAEVANTSAGASTSGNPLSSINPADIASIDVLKDASATAIYGSRGANGVVIITTKGGEKGKGRFNVDVYTAFSQASKKLEVLNAVDYAAYRHARDPFDERFGEDTTGDGILDTPADYTDSLGVNWQDELLRTAITQSYNVSYSGGNKNTSYSAGVGVHLQEGIITHNNWDRYSSRFKIDHKVNKNFEVGSSLNFSHSMNNGVVTGGGVGDWNGSIQKMILFRPFRTDGEYVDDETSGITEPDILLRDAQKEGGFTNALGNFFAQYTIIKGLNLKATIGGRLTDSKIKEFFPSHVGIGKTTNAYAHTANIKSLSWFSENLLTYNFKVQDAHQFVVQAGFEMEEYTNERFSIQNQNFEIETNGYDDLSKALAVSGYNSNKYGRSRISYFTRLNYNLKERYLLTASWRADGTSRVGKDNKFDYFPSTALAWRMTEEPFMKSQSVIDMLKWRVGYGVTGNDRVPSYASLAQFGNAYYSSAGLALSGLSPLTADNPELKWERTIQYNLGADMGFFRNNLILNVDYYFKQTTDMLLWAELPAQSGFTGQWQNIGQVDNRGLEVALNARIINKSDFSWEANLNFNRNRNKVISLGESEFLPVQYPGGWFTTPGRVIVGESIGTSYGFDFVGIYQESDFDGEGNLIEGVPAVAGVTVQPGDMKYRDISGPEGKPDGVITDEYDRMIIGNNAPDHFGGLNNSFRYKNLDLSVFLQWSYGSDIFYAGKMRLHGGHSPNLNVEYDYWNDVWTTDNPTNQTPRLEADIKRTSSYYVEDGSYLRLQTVTLGYNLPSATIKKLGMQNCRLYCTGQNLFTWTNYSGFDPEISGSNALLNGFDRISYPRATSVIVGLNVTF